MDTQTASNVSFAAIAAILLPIGAQLLITNFWYGVIAIVLGIVSLVLREELKAQ